jgi:hypothetical protein
MPSAVLLSIDQDSALSSRYNNNAEPDNQKKEVRNDRGN